MSERVQYIIDSARRYRAEGKFGASFDYAKAELAGRPQHQHLVWQHQPFFWSDMHAGGLTLRRRNARDAGFLEALWADTGFRRRFHRQAPDLLPRDGLERLLQQEFLSLLGESAALHWVVWCRRGIPRGILSITEVSMQHRRAEVLLGLTPHTPAGVCAAAMLMLFQFYFRVMRFNKLCALVYADNGHALQSTLHLGFRLEGTLRSHMRDPQTGQYADLHQLGLLETDAFSEANSRLSRRLLGPRATSL